MPKTPEDLFAYLKSLGIETSTARHPPLHTVAESQQLRGEIAGAHTKNLFLKDRKDSYFLLTVGEEDSVDLKTVHEIIGAAGKVSFGKPEAMLDLLGVTPGGVTVFGLINDAQGQVKMALDAKLAVADIVNAHPLTNEATTSINSGDLIRFIEATGHKANVLKLTA